VVTLVRAGQYYKHSGAANGTAIIRYREAEMQTGWLNSSLKRQACSRA
jgi:hypothetical protein